MHSFLLQIIYSLCKEVFANPENNYEVSLIVVLDLCTAKSSDRSYLIHCEEWLQI